MADEGLSGEMGAKKFHGCVEATNVRSVISTLKSHAILKSPNILHLIDQKTEMHLLRPSMAMLQLK
jgi:deoxyxylulose-5-phosphate synthase